MKIKRLSLTLVASVLALALVSRYEHTLSPRIPGEPVVARAASAEPKDPVADLAAPVIGSAGCTHDGIEAGRTLVRGLQSGGLSRSYRLHMSARANGGQPMAVVLNFHGRGGTGAAVEEYSGLLPVSDREGFLLVSPDGTGSTTGWGAGASLPDWPVDDIQFAKDLLRTLKQDFCVDPTRIYAVGHSNGAFMASRLACDLPGEIAAIAPVAGVYVPPEGCSTPVPVLAFHGTADDVVPFAGGVVRGTYHYRGAEQELSAWAAADHCKGAPTTRELGPRLLLEERGQCTQPVEMVLIKGAGHGWPGVAGTDLASQMDTATMIWDFFKNHQSPAQ